MTAWLVTWLWQGAAIAVSLAIALHLLPRVNAATRYVLWWGAFGALFFLGWQSWPHQAIAGSAAAIGGAAASDAPGIPMVHVQPLPAWGLSLISTVWASVALFRLMRMFPALNTFYRMKEECRPFPRDVEDELPLWLEARGRRARLMLCDRLPGAAVLGLHDPYVAVPSSLVRELSATDLDQIILHEYGHVQRYDDWMRLLQSLLESVLWMHPATFLIGRELNLEREVACDDWVVARTGAPRDYARCLSRAAEQRRSRITPAFVQGLFSGRRSLFQRVERLLDARRTPRRKPSLHAVAIGATVIAACAWQLRALPLVVEEVGKEAAPEVAQDVASGFSRTNVGAGVRTDVGTNVRANGATEHVRKPAPNSASRNLSTTMAAATAAAPAAVTVVATQGESAEMLAPQVLQGTRVFDGVYEAPPSVASTPSAASPWQLAGNAGVGIGAATRKASVGFANRVTKAGTAIARSF